MAERTLNDRFLELEDRMITTGDVIDWKKSIDWDRVNAIRDREKVKSLKCFEIL